MWPAAQVIHHAYRGGFLEHITKMAEIGRSVSAAYGADWDLVLAGIVLHDIGKLQELAYEGGAASYTRDGNMVGHIALGIVMAREAISGISGFPDDLRAHIEHLIASHHGIREHGSPVEPKTVEAFIVASVDELDAKLNQVGRRLREDPSDEEFTGWHKRLGRVSTRAVPGFHSSTVPGYATVELWNFGTSGIYSGAECERHRSVDDDPAIDRGAAFEDAHSRLRSRFTLASTITVSPGIDRRAEADALHAPEEDQEDPGSRASRGSGWRRPGPQPRSGSLAAASAGRCLGRDRYGSLIETFLTPTIR